MLLWSEHAEGSDDASHHGADHVADPDAGQELEHVADNITSVVPIAAVEPAAGIGNIVPAAVSENIDDSHSGSPFMLVRLVCSLLRAAHVFGAAGCYGVIITGAENRLRNCYKQNEKRPKPEALFRSVQFVGQAEHDFREEVKLAGVARIRVFLGDVAWIVGPVRVGASKIEVFLSLIFLGAV